MTSPNSALIRTAGVLALATALGAGMTSRGSAAQKEADPAARLAGVKLRDTAGKSRTLGDYAGRKALAIVFLGTQCPLSNSYSSVLNDLARVLGERGGALVGVNSVRGEDIAEVKAHAKEYGLAFPVLKDEKQALADLLEARVTPEAFVLDERRAVRYRGRIDDQYATRTRKNARIRSHDLRDALDAVLAGKSPAAGETVALGCAIERSGRRRSAAGPTYYRDVAPILQERCQSCHRPGQVAPFALTSYAEARAWAPEIKAFTTSRQMPPWLAEPGHGEFADPRRLSDSEIQAIAGWADAGAPAGNPKDAPPAKQWPADWTLGQPDLVLEVAEPYEVGATGDDDFRVFVLPTNLMEDRYITAMDFRPGNARVVHHIVSFVDRARKGRELDAADPGPGYSSGPGGIRIPNAEIQGVWAPGNMPRFLPDGVGRLLPRNADIVIQVHYHRTGKTEVDRSRLGLYFARAPVSRIARTGLFGSLAIDIPPGAAEHEVKASGTLPAEMTILTVMPHMHLLGRSMHFTATLPDGTRKDLVWIRQWDYRWQDSYRYKEPLVLPKGTRWELIATYDNSSGNPLNPSDPPARVRFGEQTTDEMAFAIMELYLTPGAGAPAR